jgi:hypothetical protein
MFTDVREYKSLLSLSFLIGTLAPRMNVYMFCSMKRGLCGVFSVGAYSANIFIINLCTKMAINPPTDTMSSLILKALLFFLK